jgi:hypothetical protein
MTLLGLTQPYFICWIFNFTASLSNLTFWIRRWNVVPVRYSHFFLQLLQARESTRPISLAWRVYISAPIIERPATDPVVRRKAKSKDRGCPLGGPSAAAAADTTSLNSQGDNSLRLILFINLPCGRSPRDVLRCAFAHNIMPSYLSRLL